MFDLVRLLVIANAVQNAMVGADTSVWGGLAAAAVLLGWHRVIGWVARRSKKVAKLLGGSPTLLIHDGHVLPDALAHEGLTEAELLQALREHGVATPADVRLAVLEPDGMISVVQNADVKPGVRPHQRIRMTKRAQ